MFPGSWSKEFGSQQIQEISTFSKVCRQALGHTSWVPGALSPGVKRLGCEAYHTSLSSAEVKNEWNLTVLPPYALMACTGTVYLLPLVWLCFQNSRCYSS